MHSFPEVFRVRQTFEGPRRGRRSRRRARRLDRRKSGPRLRPGQTVAVTAGSRGIANIAAILRAAVEHLRSLGAQPFLVPAMGSHGGGTAAGQQRLLESYGIAEPLVGCPVRASMETVVVCRAAAERFPVHCDRLAFEADHVLVCGRVKPHTSLAGRYESGLLKMLLVGLGKAEGAKTLHRAIADYGFDQIVASIAGEALAKCRVLAGLAIVENACDQTALVEAVAPKDFLTREPQLLELARQWMPRLPFRRADVLLIDQIGKNFSGVGFDANVAGRKFNDHQAVEGE